MPDNAIREMARVLRHGRFGLVIGDLGEVDPMGRAPAHPRLVWREDVASQLGSGRRKCLQQWPRVRASLFGSIKGAIFFPPWTVLARVMAPLDPPLGEVTTLGAAFVAIKATKPEREQVAGSYIGHGSDG